MAICYGGVMQFICVKVHVLDDISICMSAPEFSLPLDSLAAYFSRVEKAPCCKQYSAQFAEKHDLFVMYCV